MFGQFNDSFKPIMDGVGVCAENYARWLARNHGGAAVIAPSAPGYEDSDEFPVLRYPSVPFPRITPYRIGVPALGFTFRSNLRSLPLALVHAHSPFIAGRVALRVARDRGIPLVATFHTKYREDFLMVIPSKKLADLMLRKIVHFYRQASEVWAPNKKTATTLKEYGYEGQVIVMPNGTDLEIPSDREHASYREEGSRLIGNHEAPLLLFVGQHRWEKNVGLIIDAAARLKSVNANFRLAFVGTGYAEGEMKKRVVAAGLGPVTHFAGLVLNREVLKAYYARGDLFLFPSLYDNAPLVMREAAAFRCPAVLARGSSAAEEFSEGKNVFLTEPEPDAMASVLSRLLDQPGHIEAVGREAQKSIYIPWKGIVETVAERYHNLIEGRPAR
ncbi:MAG: glycosyltransferase [Spirochaetaceae bacterium]